MTGSCNYSHKTGVGDQKMKGVGLMERTKRTVRMEGKAQENIWGEWEGEEADKEGLSLSGWLFFSFFFLGLSCGCASCDDV